MRHSQMLDELREDFSDRPLEVREDTGLGACNVLPPALTPADEREHRGRVEQQQFEEGNFTRLQRKRQAPRLPPPHPVTRAEAEAQAQSGRRADTLRLWRCGRVPAAPQ